MTNHKESIKNCWIEINTKGNIIKIIKTENYINKLIRFGRLIYKEILNFFKVV